MLKIAFEGMPGAGKTSSVVKLIDLFGSSALLLPEVNFLSLPENSKDHWNPYLTEWIKRVQAVNSVELGGFFSILMDRSYYSDLAFTYAANSEQYNLIKSQYLKKLPDQFFDIIVVLDVAPEKGLARRIANRDFPPYPWSSVKFLKKFRDFYKRELSQLYMGKIVEINTDSVTSEVLLSEIVRVIDPYIPIALHEKKIKLCREEEEKLILDFADQIGGLGKPYSKAFYMMGLPTVFFRQFALQLDEDKKPVILDSSQLNKILMTHVR